ncbi:hypothetical protein G9A89_019960 [Geosiphon pyriformis]|nr:hypothetical protein G9A89_019960 [Geosiphon pyriformis]
MKKTAKVSGFNDDFKSVLSRKKRRGGALEDSSGDKVVDTKEECLVKETSFRQESGKESGSVDTNMTPKGSKKIVTKHTLGKLLDTINFDIENDNDDDILDELLSLLPPFSLKHTVQISVRKFFALDIDLEVVADKSS